MSDEIVRQEILDQIERFQTEHHYAPAHSNFEDIAIILYRIVQLIAIPDDDDKPAAVPIIRCRKLE
ncbi:MAG: hypothetical protein KAS38_14065 [Anaerolineales bacterium]|nr:hypothetical protein [Anaerolineales bacterium]